ncbi:hypothetical protein AGOR_G00156300 [Albula goreensis]|uniref:NOL9 N-terminal domain-containing protein n=1 Tax=Albula goreensis TaxID=1534307 RepID=A0A8T3D303_9TELE|nr:hypothetical protein AGOR_G00156300 [Albula goreensis]
MRSHEPNKALRFREKCQLMCLYGRVEILGFTIEEGQQAHPVFSPPTHCPLTITAMGNSATTKTQKEPRVEAKAIIQQYLPTNNASHLLCPSAGSPVGCSK